PEAAPPRVAHLVLDQRDAAQRAARRRAGLLLGHARAPVLFGLHVEVHPDLLVELTFARRALPASPWPFHVLRLLRRLHDPVHRRRQPLPRRRLFVELLAPEPGQLVDARSAVVLRARPPRPHQPLALAAAPRRTEAP